MLTTDLLLLTDSIIKIKIIVYLNEVVLLLRFSSLYLTEK